MRGNRQGAPRAPTRRYGWAAKCRTRAADGLVQATTRRSVLAHASGPRRALNWPGDFRKRPCVRSTNPRNQGRLRRISGRSRADRLGLALRACGVAVDALGGRERRLGLPREHAAPRRFTGKRLVRRMTNLGSAALLLAGSALGKTTFGGSGAFAGRQRFVSQDDWQPARGLRAPVRSSAADTPRGAPAHGRLRAHCGRASDGHRPGHHGSHRDRPDAGARPGDHDAGVARRRSGACSDWGGPTTRGRCACSAARSELTSGGGSDPRPAGRSGAGAG